MSSAAKSNQNASLQVVERARELGHLVIDVAILWKGAAGAAVPVARIAEVPFD